MPTATAPKTFTLCRNRSSVEFVPLNAFRVRITDWVNVIGKGLVLSSITTMGTREARELWADLRAKGYRTW
jgi:S1-C subfamily serine protease